MSNWNNKVVVVTGGSAGLGKAIVDTFVARGAKVVCISRSEHESTETTLHVQADVTCDQSVETAIRKILDQHQQIDVWINNVGKSIRTSLEGATLDQYRDLMEVNFFTAVRCSLAVLPHLAASSGSLVCIGSLASRTGWKHVAPYVTSKHALSGFAQQIRIEGPPNVHSLFVCPGPIRRDDSTKRYQEQAAGLNKEAAKPGAGVKISGLDPKKLATQIVRAIESRKSELVVPSKARILFAALQISPRIGDWLLRRF